MPDNIGWKMTWLKSDDLTRYVFISTSNLYMLSPRVD